MKITLVLYCIVLFTFVSLSVSAADTDSVSKKRIYYSYQQKANQGEWWNTLYYPEPSISETSFRNILASHATYPALAIKNKETELVILKTSFDKNGMITNIKLQSDSSNTFDSIAIALIKATDGSWKAAHQKKINVDTTVSIPIQFGHFFQNNKLYFYISPFFNMEIIICDSVNTFPALLPLKNNEKDSTILQYLNQNVKIDGSTIPKNQQYGTVSIGFNIDTMGHIFDISVVNSISPILDSAALKYIRGTDGKWVPSHKNGIKRPSHKEFNIFYYLKNTINGHTYQESKLDFIIALNFYNNGAFEKAIEKFNLVCKYSIHSPSSFYLRGLCHLSIGQAEKGCQDIKQSMELAEEYGFPKDMNKDIIREFLNKSCGEDE